MLPKCFHICHIILKQGEWSTSLQLQLFFGPQQESRELASCLPQIQGCHVQLLQKWLLRVSGGWDTNPVPFTTLCSLAQAFLPEVGASFPLFAEERVKGQGCPWAGLVSLGLLSDSVLSSDSSYPFSLILFRVLLISDSTAWKYYSVQLSRSFHCFSVFLHLIIF